MKEATALRYFKYDDEYSGFVEAMAYLEVDDGLVLRQITVSADGVIASNRICPPWGLCLAEGVVDEDAMEMMTAITKAEFEDIWQNHLALFAEAWTRVKEQYVVGSPVQGVIEIFYPQGVIVNLGNEILGVADYQTCKATAQPEWMYPGFQVTGRVVGFDEQNHWVIIEEPQVHGERRIEQSNSR